MISEMLMIYRLMQGRLKKCTRSSLLRRWQWKFFVLDSSKGFFYASTPQRINTNPKQIDLSKVKISKEQNKLLSEKEHKPCLQLNVDSEMPILLQAGSVQDRDAWVNSLNTCIKLLQRSHNQHIQQKQRTTYPTYNNTEYNDSSYQSPNKYKNIYTSPYSSDLDIPPP
ncbi:hypothetical protein WA158_001112, partial [Blastocystis sp. Blastoise]